MPDQGKKYVKKFALIFCLIILIPFDAAADIIFFKDGMKTVCQEKAWEEEGEVRCEYGGAILSYQKKDVIRIEKTGIEKQPESLPGKDPQTPGKTEAKQAPSAPEIKKPAPPGKKPVTQKVSKIVPPKPDMAKTKGLQFYNPRRPQKYWTSEVSKHHSFKEAIASLAKQHDRSPEGIQHHTGETNDLSEIHQNLSMGKLNAQLTVPEADTERSLVSPI